MTRASHHTNLEGLKGIKKDDAINPPRGNPIGVDVDVEPFTTIVPEPGGPCAETGAVGEGAYVEFDLPDYAIPTNNIGQRKTAKIPCDLPLPINELNPVFVVKKRWWNLWYIWRERR